MQFAQLHFGLIHAIDINIVVDLIKTRLILSLNLTDLM